MRHARGQDIVAEFPPVSITALTLGVGIHTRDQGRVRNERHPAYKKLSYICVEQPNWSLLIMEIRKHRVPVKQLCIALDLSWHLLNKLIDAESYPSWATGQAILKLHQEIVPK